MPAIGFNKELGMTEHRCDVCGVITPWSETNIFGECKVCSCADLIRRALDAAGYSDEEPTPEALRECFADYVDAGVWADISLEDIDSLSVADMCMALICIRW